MPIVSKKAECAKHVDCIAQFKLCWQSEAAILPFRLTTDLWLARCVIKMRENSLFRSAKCQVRVIEGQFVPREPKLVRIIGSFEKSRVREIGGEIVELESSKSKGNKIWFEISGSSGNRGFEKSGFHCIKLCLLLRFEFSKTMALLLSVFRDFFHSVSQKHSGVKLDSVGTQLMMTFLFPTGDELVHVGTYKAFIPRVCWSVFSGLIRTFLTVFCFFFRR